jgi:hypothetical protein
MPAAPFRVFGIAARPQPLPPEVVLFWNWLLVQSMPPATVSPLLVLRSRFAVSTCPGCAVFLLRAAANYTLGCRLRPLVELHLSSRVLPSNTYPAAATAESSHGLLLPSAHQESEVYLPRVKPARYVPSSGFVYPLDGLLPRIPCRFCFTPAALVGFSLRRSSLPQGSTAFRPGKTCIPLAQR